jgi:predicted membrane protein
MMIMSLAAAAVEGAHGVVGYVYPNEIEAHWSLLIVIYPYLTGLVAGAFILASLERVFNVEAARPTYRLALLTALAYLIIAPMPLLAHLSQPLRFWETLVTPHHQSAMAMFGFVYIWYLLVVLLLEIWFEYRADMVRWSYQTTGWKSTAYKILTLGVFDISPRALAFDDKAIRIISVIGIPSAFLLHGYVGFIFGSIKANPWWSSVLMPVIFLFSAIVSGIALVILIFMVATAIRRKPQVMPSLDTLSKYLFYILILDFTLEGLDVLHRTYAADESFDILYALVHGRLFETHMIFQLGFGTLVPLTLIGIIQIAKISPQLRQAFYWISTVSVLFGVFFMRWNIVIGGQLFSKSFRGYTVYKMELFGPESLLTGILFMILPVGILLALIYFLPPWIDDIKTTWKERGELEVGEEYDGGAEPRVSGTLSS